MSNLIQSTPELEGVEESKALQIKKTFEPMVEMLESFEDRFEEINKIKEQDYNPELIAKAKRLRLDIAQVRIKTDKIRKEAKEEYLRAGKAIDGVSNIVKWAVSDKESRLKEIETYHERQEQERKEKLYHDRLEQLEPFDPDASLRNLADMKDDEFEALLSLKKKQHEELLEAQKIVREREAKEQLFKDRIQACGALVQFIEDEDPDMREMTEKEFKAFQKVLFGREAEHKAEQERIRKEAEAEKEKARIAQEELRAEREKIQKEREAQEAEIRAQRKAREAAEQKAREEEEKRLLAEREAENARIRKEQKALSLKDADKIEDLITDLEEIKVKYNFRSATNKKMFNSVLTLIDKVIVYIHSNKA